MLSITGIENYTKASIYILAVLLFRLGTGINLNSSVLLSSWQRKLVLLEWGF